VEVEVTYLVVQEVLTLVEELLLLDLEVEWLELLDLEELLLLLLSVDQTEVVGVLLLSVVHTEEVGVVFDSVVFLEVVSTQPLLEDEAPQPAEEEVVLTSFELLLLLLLSDAQGRATAKLLTISSMQIVSSIESLTWKQAVRRLRLEC
jgi:hypothetical protein